LDEESVPDLKQKGIVFMVEGFEGPLEEEYIKFELKAVVAKIYICKLLKTIYQTLTNLIMYLPSHR
jgi:hypothetical protein